MQEECFEGFLNDDCWKYVLDYVPVKDIVSVAQVCSRWDAVVQRYIQGVRLRIETITNFWDEDEARRRRKCRIMIIEDDNVCFNAVLGKLGHFVMELVYDARLANENILWDLGEKCPNIQNITFIGLKWNISPCAWAANFTKLKRICFENGSISDACIGELLKNNNIEELVIRMVDSVTGSFLAENGGALSNLKTIILYNCPQFKELLSAVEPVNYLFGVTTLDMRELSSHIYMRLHLILDKMPQLDHLTLDCRRHLLLKEELIAAIGRLGHLQCLGWLYGVVLRGCELEAALKDGSLLPRRVPREASLIGLRDPHWREWTKHRHVLYRRQFPNGQPVCDRYLAVSVIFGEEAFSEAVKLKISSFSHKEISKDVIFRIHLVRGPPD